MNISHEHKFVFIHIPKTAGLTVSSAIGLTKPPEHLNQNLIVENQSNGLDVSEYYKFAFCRNPWDRFLSLYYYCRDGSEMYGNSENSQKNTLDFKMFCRIFQMGFFVGNSYVWGIHYKPQIEFINLSDIDFIGRFENLQQDFNVICDKIGIPQQKLPHKNKTKHKHYTEYYDDETRQIVAEKFAKDIEYFGYKFGE
jgi:chondroitin 4-sulfotransferase 11